MKKPSLNAYIIGYFLSVILTVAAFVTTQMHVGSGHIFIPHNLIIPVLIIFALMQMIVQLIYFLHVWNEKKPKWNLLFFIGTFGLVLMVVIASIWIMNHLEYNHMNAQSTAEYILIDEGVKLKDNDSPNNH